MATETTESPFNLRSLVTDAGTASNGEKLIEAVTNFYPPELQEAQLLSPNVELSRTLDWKQVAKIAGVKIGDAVVRGGERDRDEAVVTYAGYDADGDTIKGFFPHSDLGKSSSDGHISQRDRLQDTEAARAHAESQEKARAAAGSEETAALKARIAELEEQVEQDGGDPEPLPVDQYDKAKAKDIVTMVGAADRETAARVLDYERRHEDRSTVTEAAEKRIEALDGEDAKVREENEQLKARIAELEKNASGTTSGDGGQ